MNKLVFCKNVLGTDEDKRDSVSIEIFADGEVVFDASVCRYDNSFAVLKPDEARDALRIMVEEFRKLDYEQSKEGVESEAFEVFVPEEENISLSAIGEGQVVDELTRVESENTRVTKRLAFVISKLEVLVGKIGLVNEASHGMFKVDVNDLLKEPEIKNEKL